MYVDSGGNFSVHSSWRKRNADDTVTLNQLDGLARNAFTNTEWNNMAMVILYKPDEDATYIKGYINGVEVITKSMAGRALRMDAKKPLAIGGQVWFNPLTIPPPPYHQAPYPDNLLCRVIIIFSTAKSMMCGFIPKL
jgi:hypothetical protein